MNEPQKRNRGSRKPRELDTEIAEAEARLRMLIDAKKEKERRDLEANRQAIAALLKAKGLDRIGVVEWREIAPRLEELLTAKPRQKPKKAAERDVEYQEEASSSGGF